MAKAIEVEGVWLTAHETRIVLLVQRNGTLYKLGTWDHEPGESIISHEFGAEAIEGAPEFSWRGMTK